MDQPRFELKQQMHLPEMDKLWGWFVMGDDPKPRRHHAADIWCWWAVAGKGISVSRRQGMLYGRPSMAHLEKEKIKNGYHPISKEDLIGLWPTFMEDLNNRIIYELLVNHG